jgi:phage tail tape-measure protein
MRNKRNSNGERNETSAESLDRALRPRISHTDAASLSGSLVGAALGAIGGPAGVVAGGLVGTAIGALTGRALDNEEAADEAEDAKLDAVIGVSGGPMGAASPNTPKARVGCYSAGSAGVAAPSSSAPSEGPMQDLDGDD